MFEREEFRLKKDPGNYFGLHMLLIFSKNQLHPLRCAHLRLHAYCKGETLTHDLQRPAISGDTFTAA